MITLNSGSRELVVDNYLPSVHDAIIIEIEDMSTDMYANIQLDYAQAHQLACALNVMIGEYDV